MQGNRDGLWSLNASMNYGRGGRGNGIINIVSQANHAFPSFNQPIRYHPLPQFPASFYRPGFGNPNYQTQQSHNFHHQQIPPKFDGKSPPLSLPNNDISITSRKRMRKEEVVVQETDDVVVKETPKSKFDSGESDNSFSGGSRVEEGKGSSKKSKRKVEIMRIEKAIKKTRKSVIADGESVSSTRVSQAVLDKLQADSWSSLGVKMEDVPSLRQLMAIEGKINAFIHCFVGARQIVTLHDLEVAICHNESVDSFDDLKLGPLLQHPLVLLYFPSISSSGPLEITSEEIISFLDIYLHTHKTEDVKLDEFLNFVARQKSVKSKKKLGVRIQNLGMYVSLILDAKRQEAETLKAVLTKVNQKYHIPSSKKQQHESLSDRAAKEISFYSSSSGELSRVRDQLQTIITPWAEQAQQTGRKGEEIAYKYYVGKYGKDGLVRWVNNQSETGLPYDLLIEKRDGKKEYVEVKATVSTMKDYFNLTVKEWEFGSEKGESYIIAHVLLGNNSAILTQHRNPVKLCQDGYLRLMVLMPNQKNGVNVAF